MELKLYLQKPEVRVIVSGVAFLMATEEADADDICAGFDMLAKRLSDEQLDEAVAEILHQAALKKAMLEKAGWIFPAED